MEAIQIITFRLTDVSNLEATFNLNMRLRLSQYQPFDRMQVEATSNHI